MPNALLTTPVGTCVAARQHPVRALACRRGHAFTGDMTSDEDTWRPAPASSGVLTDPGVRLGAAYAGFTVALLVAAAVDLPSAATELLVGVVAALASVGVSVPVSGAVGALGWAFFTGFVEHRYGELTFGAGDLLRLLLLVAGPVWVARSGRSSRRCCAGGTLVGAGEEADR